MSTLLLTLSLLPVVLASASEVQEGRCAITRSAEDLIGSGDLVHTQLESVPGESIRKALALTRIEAPAGLVYQVVTDEESFPRILPYVDKARLVGGDGATVLRQRVDLPFPLQNRHYDLLVERSPGSPCAETRWRYLPGTGNIEDTYGRWEVLEMGESSTLLAYVVWVDLGGVLPPWVQNWASQRALPRVMRAIEDEVLRRLGR